MTCLPPANAIRVATWNVAWQRPAGAAGTAMRERLLAASPDVAVITEAEAGFIGDTGHVACAGPDYGYCRVGDRRKVLLWSRQPWTAIDTTGDPGMPPGRFVAARTETRAGPLLLVGVCIPWAAAHVSTGRRDRARWEDHLAFLAGAGRYLRSRSGPFVVAGDFNQAVPRRTAPVHVFEALGREVLGNVELFTGGEIEGCGQAIDHVAGSAGMSCTGVRGLPARDPGGKALSDHFGLVVDLQLAGREGEYLADDSLPGK